MHKRIALFLCVTGLFLLTGCQTPELFKQTDRNVADVTQKVNEADAKSDASGKTLPALVMKNELYVDKTPISLAKQPSWLKKQVVLRGGPLPFSYYTRSIVNPNVLIHYQSGLDSSVQLSLNYTGDVKGALDLLSAKTGYVYTINGNDIEWQAYVTKTFEIAFMPGSVEYAMGGEKTAVPGASNGGSSGSSGSSSGSSDSGSGPFSSLKGSLSVWKDLETTVKNLLSPEGKVMVSQATTSITVRDKPVNVELVEKYIENLNGSLSRQVLVKIQVLDISLSSAFNYGIDWSIVKRGFMGTNFVLNANYGTPVSITPAATTGPLAFGAGNVVNLNTSGLPQLGFMQSDPTHITGVNALISALQQQGKVSVVSEPRVVCLNNQVSVINIVDKQGYAASVSSTTFSGGTGNGGSSVTSSIVPGTVETGLVLYVLPKIMNDKIFLQVDASLSNKVSIDPFTSGQGAGSASIQVPHTTEKQFNQRSVIGSGDTLILSGFRQVSNQSGAMQLFGAQALGGKAASQLTTETVVLITPIVLNGFI